MPIRTIVIHLCSICEEEKTEMIQLELKGLPGGPLFFDVCSDCESTASFKSFVGYGEKRSKGGTAPKAKPKAPAAKAASNGTPVPEPPLERNDAGHFMCPEEDCAYTSHHAPAVGRHRSVRHGYVSTKGK